MSCSSAMYAANTEEQKLNPGELVSLGKPVRRFGKAISMDNGVNIQLMQRGYYFIMVSLDVRTCYGNGGGVVADICLNGEPYNGARASQSATLYDTVNLVIPCMIRVCEEDVTDILTVQLTSGGRVMRTSVEVLKV